MEGFIPEIIIIKFQRNKLKVTLVTTAKDKQKLANQHETEVWVGLTGYYSETTQNTDI